MNAALIESILGDSTNKLTTIHTQRRDYNIVSNEQIVYDSDALKGSYITLFSYTGWIGDQRESTHTIIDVNLIEAISYTKVSY